MSINTYQQFNIKQLNLRLHKYTFVCSFTCKFVVNLTVAHQDYFGISLEQSSTIDAVHVGVLFVLGEY